MRLKVEAIAPKRGDEIMDASFFYFFYFFIASNTHTKKKQKLHRINKVIKGKKKVTNKVTKEKTNSEFTHLHGNILTNIKIRYSNGNSIYYCTSYNL